MCVDEDYSGVWREREGKSGINVDFFRFVRVSTNTSNSLTWSNVDLSGSLGSR